MSIAYNGAAAGYAGPSVYWFHVTIDSIGTGAHTPAPVRLSHSSVYTPDFVNHTMPA